MCIVLFLDIGISLHNMFKLQHIEITSAHSMHHALSSWWNIFVSCCLCLLAHSFLMLLLNIVPPDFPCLHNSALKVILDASDNLQYTDIWDGT